MATKNRPSVKKREREQMKRQRERQKVEKAAQKRERRLERSDQDSSLPPGTGDQASWVDQDGNPSSH